MVGKLKLPIISLKSAAGDTFDEAKELFRNIIGKEALRFPFLHLMTAAEKH